MEVASEQQTTPVVENLTANTEQQQQPPEHHNDEPMDETETDYNYEANQGAEEYRHFMPRGRGGFG